MRKFHDGLQHPARVDRAGPPYLYSWLSAAWTRVQGTVENVVKAVPIIGAPAAAVLDDIHTGDEHQDANGNWVSNDTGAPVVTPPSSTLAAAQQSASQFNADEQARIRQAAADLVARAGVGAAAAIGPAGNIYQQGVALFSSPLTIFIVLAALVGGGYLLFHKKH